MRRDMKRNRFFILLALVLLGGDSVGSAPTTRAVATSQPAEPWSTRPTDQWPQLVLTNEASFDQHTPLHGASAFLARMPDGGVVVATAKHLTKKPGGVEPPIP